MSRNFRKSRRYPKAYQTNSPQPGQIIFSVLTQLNPPKKILMSKFLEYAKLQYIGSSHFQKIIRITKNIIIVQNITSIPYNVIQISHQPKEYSLRLLNETWTRYIIKPAFIKQLVKKGLVKITNEKLLY